MSAPTLPTKETFIASNLEAMTCDICREAFTDEHIATRIRGDKCQHIFGSTCLQAWMDSDSNQSNTCPMCREVLFAKPPEIPILIAGERPDGIHAWHLEGLGTAHAWLFVNMLYAEINETKGMETLYDSDLRAEIDASMHNTAMTEPSFFTCGLAMYASESMPRLLAVVKDMVVAPRTEEMDAVDADDQTTHAVWFERVSTALFWELD